MEINARTRTISHVEVASALTTPAINIADAWPAIAQLIAITDTNATVAAARPACSRTDLGAHQAAAVSLPFVKLEDAKANKPMEHAAIQNINVKLKYAMSRFVME